ncbi:MAG: hypothetical protein HYY76_02235 [Acidobacteria bacterium]|nr:hypothetical protein [Acidobacteriota bacterium]
MLCASCGRRKGRRECPALGRTICTVCCGTKRLVEIRCPNDCAYLAVAREHPAAVVRRQQERDVARLLPTIQHLTERQYRLFFRFHTAIARHKPGVSIADGFTRLVDADIAEAAAALASTLETAARGVIYEHTPQSLPAQSLAVALRTTLAQVREQGARVYDGEAAVALRAIEQGARMARTADEGATAYLDLVGRLLRVAGPAETARPDSPAPSSLIIP